MKNLHLIAVSLFLTAIFSISALAQTTSANKVFVIDTGAFGDEKEGITKFINASKRLSEELKPQYTELTNLAKKIQDAANQFQTLKNQFEKDPNSPISAVSVQQKGETVERMQIEYKRKEEDLKLAIAKREQELLNPIRVDIYKAMDKFANEKKYPIILDLVQMVETKLILAIGDDKVDLTKEFIQYYNSLPTGTANSK
jgi:Skp family chaperone for outer membrane proteins